MNGAVQWIEKQLPCGGCALRQLAFGTGDAKIDIGPFKVVREA